MAYPENLTEALVLQREEEKTEEMAGAEDRRGRNMMIEEEAKVDMHKTKGKIAGEIKLLTLEGKTGSQIKDGKKAGDLQHLMTRE